MMHKKQGWCSCHNSVSCSFFFFLHYSSVLKKRQKAAKHGWVVTSDLIVRFSTYFSLFSPLLMIPWNILSIQEIIFLMTKNTLVWQFCGDTPASVICLSLLHRCVCRQSCSPQPWHPRLWWMLVPAVCVGIVTPGCQKCVALWTQEHLLTQRRASVKMEHAGYRVSGRR